MRVLVTGAYGFIGRHVVAALLARGHEVVAAVRDARRGTRLPGVEAVACDFGADVDPAAWHARLAGIDAVVNCAGILRETGADSFERVHREVPLALARACVAAGVARLVQVSALGDPADGAFVASKHAADAALLELDLAVTVLRPSVVYATNGSYGGTSLLRALAATPWLLPLPGDGRQCIQPLHAEDLAEMVVAALARPEPYRGILNVGGPEALTLREYLEGFRRWLGIPGHRVLPVPPVLMDFGARLGEWFGSGPLGLGTWRMTRRGNAPTPEDVARQRAVLGLAGRSFGDALRAAPCQTQDRWHARLYPLAPTLRAALALVCLVSAFAGLHLAPDEIVALAAPMRLAPSVAVALGYGGSVVDAVLGVLLLVPRAAPAAARALLLLVLGYTLALGLGLPALWLDPFGGLVKNLVVVPAILVYLVLADRR